MTRDDTARSGPSDRTLLLVRWILPAIVCLSGVVAFAVSPSSINAEGGAGLMGAGLSWMLLGYLFRVGVRGDEEREVEQAAREYLDAHGRWPTEDEYATFQRSGRWTAPDRDRVAAGA
jgi:hypothetical protein